MALGNGTEEIRARDCLGKPGSYGNLVSPDGTKSWPLKLRSDFCVQVERLWTDPKCPHVHWPVQSHIQISADPGTGRGAMELTHRVIVNDSVVRLPLLDCTLAYFEGASLSNGTHAGAKVSGRGFTEHQWDLS
jgi:hypothetical protein